MVHPIYHCAHVTRDLILTGRLDDPLWESAEVAELTDPVTGGPKRYRTTVRALYSARYFHIGFFCEDSYVWGTFTERDAPIFTEECVEAFICPSGRWRQYYEINVSPLNTVFDAFVLNATDPGGDRSIRGFTEYTCEDMLTAVHVDGELGAPGARSWSAEYAIPFTSIIGHDHLFPEPGDEWRINFYRIDSEQANALDLYAWATTGVNDFHTPWSFGTLRFA